MAEAPSEAMTPQERATMRAIVGAAAKRAYLPGGAGHPGQVPILPDARDTAALVDRFRLEFEALAGVVHHAASLEEIVAVVTRIAERLPTRQVLAWDEQPLGFPGLHRQLIAAGLSLVPPGLDQQGEGRPGQIAQLDSASIGLTGVDAAIAETGSIVVVSGPGRPRLASLLTPVHIALVRHRDIVPSLRGLVRSRAALASAGSNVVVITGPSRTADIEHTLSRGVHGPGEVHVILVNDE
jgi:L-lactate dehydrogenase complex protein LldG